MSSNTSLKQNVLVGLFWQYFQRIGSQTVSFIVSIILARLLVPADFGAIALISVFITICNIFIDSGLGNALIQRKEIDETDTSSVFYTNIVVAAILYCGLFFSAPMVSRFYDMEILTPILRILSLQLFAMSLCCVQNAILIRTMKFKINFYVNISGVVISSIIGVSCAYNGLGIWSLVYSQLTMQIIHVTGYWLLVGWRPKLRFSFERVRNLFGYGSSILAGSLLHVIYNNIYNLVIGKRYTSTELGFYNRGYLIPTLIVDNAANTINSVMFPALSKLQDDKVRFLNLVRKMVTTVAFIVFLLMGTLLPLSSSLISVLLTDKWLSAVPFMQIVCVTVCFTPFILINSAILTALGESGKYLKAVTISKVLSIVIIMAASFVNVYFMVSCGILSAIISVVIMGFWNKQLIGYSVAMFMQDVLPSMGVASIVSILLTCFTFFNLPNVVTLIVGSVIACFIYLLLAKLFKFKQLQTIAELIKKR